MWFTLNELSFFNFSDAEVEELILKTNLWWMASYLATLYTLNSFKTILLFKSWQSWMLLLIFSFWYWILFYMPRQVLRKERKEAKGFSPLMTFITVYWWDFKINKIFISCLTDISFANLFFLVEWTSVVKCLAECLMHFQAVLLCALHSNCWE